MKQLLFYCLVASFLFTSCGSSYEPLSFKEGSQDAIDNGIIIEHLTSNGIKGAQHTESGIYYVIEKEGTGDHPTATSKIQAHYTGTLLDGTKFDSSVDRGQPLNFQLNGVIKGWGEGIPLLKKGGKGTFYIPSSLAYGPRAVGRSIPANSILAFDIELIDFQNNAAAPMNGIPQIKANAADAAAKAKDAAEKVKEAAEKGADAIKKATESK